MTPKPRIIPVDAPSGPWRSVIMGLLAGAMLVVGCGKNAPSAEMPGDAGADAAAEPAERVDEPDEGLAGYELELAGYEDAMLVAGLELPGTAVEARAGRGKASVPATDGGASLAGQRCERICGLATNICGLATNICELADQHDREIRYTRACERANLDCERATEACEGCED